MTFTVNHIPQCITGTDPRPPLYGQTARQWYGELMQQAKDEFVRSGNREPLDKLANATIRYTPSGTISKQGITETAINNALGYAKEDIKAIDQDGDGAVSLQELANSNKQTIVDGMSRLAQQYQAIEKSDASPEAKQQALASYTNQLNALQNQYANSLKDAVNYFKAVDTKGPGGQTDNKLTADEVAAKLLFDDAAPELFSNPENQGVYQYLIHELQSSPQLQTPDTQYTGPNFETLKHNIDQIEQKPRGMGETLEKDGQITQDKRDIANELTAVPIVTNQFISSIHSSLQLRERANSIAAQNTHAPQNT